MAQPDCRSSLLLAVLVLAFALLPASTLAQSEPITDAFELGDSQAPPVSGTGDVLSVSEIAGPDWSELFRADGSLRDDVGADGNPPANGIPDYVDLYGGLDALFIADEISVGSATDLTIRRGSDHVDTGTIVNPDDLGNTYVYMTRDSAGRLLLYAGIERLDSGPSQVQIELNQGHFRLGHGWPGASGWEVVGQRVEKDLRVTLSFTAEGLLGSATVESWEDPEADGVLDWVVRETLAAEGCNPGDPLATPARDADSFCAFRNDAEVPGGPWPSYDGTGAETAMIPGDTFFEIGVNVGHLLEISDPSYRFTTIRLWTPTDLAFGHFGEESGS